ncbi:RNA polymerase sigma factor RpoE [bacterium (Candidatus Blackallbacteria) CG17_big_fil_post_rev_8_21_14_2_50_48_46]|uniref:RNA polymerase sigma factor RpoE n=1 Tax=bacterium (Candidatus Blackallbacteria) CG17_big_fil_post_rev_8_21_14_2_50_48_46 TaxID=2014261 RepID=A0A2M7FXJ1_9BACT|nr:MAG: RNA polymerase sigma factor RpoE [bacterium (Candidatus Blackallbacteria) CG18_big_fil_WC_8_21_14_2_50_49_26]PIW13865.1 MAG: RNA polymerase sigma factor RpoE [bacterium (Candidatus Blackallbacteria) CG17_big_fil_post_rev_8_21_14_2_50_48_46]PIW45091.1 MAG: RNA polymerase sigma factor RpoE [bacterium (Candidatus Blackallbacteria) CG13_big_fil_rev_8_21_14_2_50_49_14]
MIQPDNNKRTDVNNELIQKLNRAQQGDQQAFKEVVKEFMPQLYSMVHAMIPQHEDVNDILQEVFVKVHRALPQLQNKQAFRSWLYRIALNTARNHLRSRFRRELPTEPETFLLETGESGEKLPEQLERAEIRQRILQAIETLSPEHRDVVTLVELEELNCAEAAEVLECPAGTVRSRLHYARKKLKELLQPYFANKGESP